MLPEDENLIREIFTEAIVLPNEEWAGLLSRRTDRPEIAAAVRRLLDHHVASEDFLAQPAVQSFPLTSSPFGAALEEFRLIRELGRGGMGVVYLAEDMSLKRGVALKVLHTSSDPDGSYLARFTREARTVAKLSHPGIVKVFRAGKHADVAFIAMEYVEGSTLRQKFSDYARERRGGVKARPDARYLEVAALIAEVAEALDHAHRNGVVHRDVKPSNIMVDAEGHAHLTDFGIARTVTETTLTSDDAIAGSIPYMSPEQARVANSQVDHRTDIFSLGVVLYEALTSKRPFDGATNPAILHALLTSDPVPLQRVDKSIPRDLAVICHKAIEKPVLDRYQTAAALAADLRTFIAGGPILAGPPSYWKRFRRFSAKRQRTLVVVSILMLLAGLIASMYTVRTVKQSHMAWIRMEPFHAPLAVYLDPCDATGSPMVARRRVLGNLPVDLRDIELGQYRLTCVDESRSAFCEFNLILLEPGSPGETTVKVVDSGSQLQSLDEHTLVGVLRPTDEVTAGMIACGAGPFRLDVSPEGHQLFPGPVTIEPFLIDKWAVSNRDYDTFIRSTGYSDRTKWLGDVAAEDIADRPITNVSLADAEAYARWQGKRLPTLAEWMAAARGQEGRLYPWGNEEPPETVPDLGDFGQSANIARIRRDYLRLVRPASRPAAGDVDTGMLHSFSNVRELTGTIVPGEKLFQFVGRAWSDDPRAYTLATVRSTRIKYPSLRTGFRCAKSVRVRKGNS